MFRRCRQTIESVIKRCKEGGSSENVARGGSPKLLATREDAKY